MSAILQLDAHDLDHFTREELIVIEWMVHWRKQARIKQLPPLGPWDTWGIMTGRGFGKTLTGAHWIGEEAGLNPHTYNALITTTLDDVREVMIEGPTGILATFPEPNRLIVDYNKSLHKLTLWNGSVIRGFSAEKPRKLRGPQHDKAWGDEVAAWENGIDTYNMMRFGLRLGPHPQFLWTTTPQPNRIVKRLLAEKNSVVVRGSSYENKANLSQVFWNTISQYEGSKIGRQELDGELIDSEEGGFVKNSQIRRWPATRPLPQFKFVITSLDTAFSEKTMDKKTRDPDYSAQHVYGIFVQGTEYHVMLLDAWREHLSFPELCKRVKDEMGQIWGGADAPLIKPMFGPNQVSQHTGKKSDITIIEDKGSGISLRQQLASENILTHPYNPGRADKLMRLHTVTPIFASGRFWMVESESIPENVKSWAEPVRAVLCEYSGPGSVEHDDDLDACTQALAFIKDKFLGTLTSQKPQSVVSSEPREPPRPLINPYAQ